jgi:4Fe-4S ferredoxin
LKPRHISFYIELESFMPYNEDFLARDFMNRGVVMKRKLDTMLVLERKMLTSRYVLSLNHNYCVGCGICVSVCPEEAAKLSPAVMHDGRLIKKPLLDIDTAKCTFCGECVVLCPTNAIKTQINGAERVPVVEAKAFPTLTKEITVNLKNCNPVCHLVCQESCPTKAIEIAVERTEKGDISKILDVKVDKEKCIFCKRCEIACPLTAICVTMPIQGSIKLDANLCPDDCQVCVDICPSKAITLSEEGKPSLAEEFCIYCGACQEACPERAIIVKRLRILHTEVKSGAWITALKKLTSPTSLVKELSVKSGKKLREAVKNIDRF